MEFSSYWKQHYIHLVGLNVNRRHPATDELCQAQLRGRLERAIGIAERLEKRGVADSLAGAQRIAAGATLSRNHFAAYLIEQGVVGTRVQAFKKYLGGRDGSDARQHWASMDLVIEAIRSDGGTAVLAHPAKYRMTRTRLGRLTSEFAELGGNGLEVVSGKQHPDTTRSLVQLANTNGLAGSIGSDFHRSGEPWAALGQCGSLPAGVMPVWDDW